MTGYSPTPLIKKLGYREGQTAWLIAAPSGLPDGVLWISWPKKASKVPTDITEDVLPGGNFADGACRHQDLCVDEVWSGLKFMFRKELRAKLAF